MTDQQPLIEDGKDKPRTMRTMRKTRIDKGVRRKPDLSAREYALKYFAAMDAVEKQRFIDDCSLILRFCDPAYAKAFNEIEIKAAEG